MNSIYPHFSIDFMWPLKITDAPYYIHQAAMNILPATFML
jgi:hypothetical protein